MQISPAAGLDRGIENHSTPMPGEIGAGPVRSRALTPNPGIAETILPLTPEGGWASLEKSEST